MPTPFVSVKNAFSLTVGSEITLRGWVRSRRDSKGVTFIELNDGYPPVASRPASSLASTDLARVTTPGDRPASLATAMP